MKERTQSIIGIIIVVAMFLFVGTAVMVNIQDELTGSNYAYGFNVIGFCLVPIFAIVGCVCYRHITKNPDGVV